MIDVSLAKIYQREELGLVKIYWSRLSISHSAKDFIVFSSFYLLFETCLHYVSSSNRIRKPSFQIEILEKI
ncbi:hypothetical protein HI914_02183 [Erysiphe necator]|nr:hypothetical protein HI914_02183 [Erysiphe necator]